MTKRAEVQISAFVSKETKKKVEEYTRATGLKKGRVLETALLYHFQALNEIPAEMVIPPRLVVSRKVGERVIHRIKKPQKPTKALRDLMSDD